MVIPPQFRKRIEAARKGNSAGGTKVPPAKLEKCVLDLKDQGRSKPAAFAICNAQLAKKENNKK